MTVKSTKKMTHQPAFLIKSTITNPNGKQVTTNFEGGKITLDAGIVLIAELDKKLKITARFSDCFEDHRH